MAVPATNQKGKKLMADVISLDEHRAPPNPGNGAREALIELFSGTNVSDPEQFADTLLAELWMRGFMVAPLNG
ncbi:MAG: hypothetical protein KGJ13_09385 [Patescibacteria group bacterium]|nr:hypothetical protein [Patescibacteria group bacterium]